MPTALETAIIKTLAYADLFNQALTAHELHRLLIGLKLDNPRPIEHRRFSKIEHVNQCFALVGRSDLLEAKGDQQRTTNRKLGTARSWLWLFKLVPWVQLVAVSGSVAGGSPKADDDIDLLIITAPKRLWTSRLIITTLLSLTGKRRRPSDDPLHVNDKLCLNMWRSCSDLAEPHHDLYTAMELAHLRPLVNRAHTYSAYLQANSWMKEYLPNVQLDTKQNAQQKKTFTLGFLDQLESLAQAFQLKIMRSQTNESVTSTSLKFHPHDYRSEILKRYQQRLRQLGVE